MGEILWVKSARKEFETFPAGAREIILSALVVAAEGKKADIAKPMKASDQASWESLCHTGPMPIGSSMQCS
jgi:phage-related protein